LQHIIKDSGLYIQLWQKYKPAIVSKLKSAVDSPQTFQLSKQEFVAAGDRFLSGYHFNLEIADGAIINNISGNVVARDLFEVLRQSPAANALVKDHLFKINLTRAFVLTIQTF